jgi:hypothetical protein
MDLPDRARTQDRSPARRPRRAASPPRPRPRRPSALPPDLDRGVELARQQWGLPVAFVRGLPATVGAVGFAFFVVQAALGWGLGVAGAGLTVLVAVMLLAVLAVTDALGGRPTEDEDEEQGYDLVVCGAVATTVAVAIACLYLPLPWGGLCAAVVLGGLIVAMHLR